MQGRSSKPIFKLGMTAVLALAACHGSGSSSNNSSFTIGGTITGLNAGSVVLANGSVTVTVSAGASSWVFPSSFASNSSYAVTVLTQPAQELCEVSGGSGTTLPGDLDTVTVECSDYGQWIWEGGVSSVNAGGVYGTEGTAAASNVPGARYAASSWADSSGNFWLFGGVGDDSSGGAGNLNDLWRYSPSSGQWTWISGGNVDNAAGSYGTLGTASASNVPGARYAASSWADSSGNLWLFGGYGEDSTGSVGKLNDLWRYSPSTQEWTWISGEGVVNATGVYGTQGAAAIGNEPGARQAGSSWIDPSGNLWLFGGYGYDSSGVLGYLNDLWKYSPGTQEWTWINGSRGNNDSGVYGTQAVAAAGNLPGGRQAANSWVDSSGDLWLFGAYGYDATGDLGALNDLWRFSPSTQEWTWVSGGNVVNGSGAYGTQGTGAAGNQPGARQAANSWVDSSGNLWLFGGAGYGATGNGYLSDLWRFVRPK